MRKAVLAVAVLACAAGLAATERAGARVACTPGATKVNGTDARTFCGPAKATLRFGTAVLHFAGGSCDRTAKYVAVDIGTVVLGTAKGRRPDYFGLVVGQLTSPSQTPAGHDGTYRSGVVVANSSGKSYLVDGRTLVVTLKGGRTRGTFTGSSLLLSPAVKVTGSFSC